MREGSEGLGLRCITWPLQQLQSLDHSYCYRSYILQGLRLSCKHDSYRTLSNSGARAEPCKRARPGSLNPQRRAGSAGGVLREDHAPASAGCSVSSRAQLALGAGTGKGQRRQPMAEQLAALLGSKGARLAQPQHSGRQLPAGGGGGGAGLLLPTRLTGRGRW